MWTELIRLEVELRRLRTFVLHKRGEFIDELIDREM